MKPKILVAVYNTIEHDGRVKRSCETLSDHYEVQLFCVSGEEIYESDAYGITRCSLPKGFPAVARLFLFWLKFIRYVWRHEPQLVYAHDFFLAFPGLVAARLVKAACVYDAHELIIPDASRKTPIRTKCFYLLEKLSIRRHNVVIAANRQRAELMANHYRLTALPVIVRNITRQTYNHRSREHILERYPILTKRNGDVHVVYVGAMDMSRGLDNIIDAFSVLPDSYKLVLIGGGPDLTRIASRASIAGSQQLKIVGPIPHDDVQDVIATGDVGIVVYSMDGLNNLYCSPNKIFEYAQAGVPVVTSCQPPLKEMVERYNIGAVVGCTEPPNRDSYAKAIHKVASQVERFGRNLLLFLRCHQIESEQQRLTNAVNRIFCAKP